METQNMVNLHMDEDASLEINFKPPEELKVDLSLCLVGRFLSDKNIRSQIMKECMSLVWKPFQGITISELEAGIFLFQFYHVS